METCSKIGPDSKANLLYATPNGTEYHNVLDAIAYHMDRARQRNRQILEFASFVPSDVLSLITAIENDGYFRIFERIYPMYKADVIRNTNLSFLARNFFDYLLIADRLDTYTQEFLPTTSTRPPYLVSGSELNSDETPLQR